MGWSPVIRLATLTTEDAAALANLPGVINVSPEVDGRAQLAYQGQNTNTRLVGVTPNYQTIRSMTMADGTFITDGNQVARSSVVVLGSGVADTLFGGVSGAVGQSVRMNGQPYRVIGVLNSKGGTGFLNQDNQVFVPLTTAQTRLAGNGRFRGANVVNTINIQAADAKSVTNVVS